MRTLILLRHGEAEAHADTGRDVDRSLTTAGVAQARGAGRALAAAGLRPDRALVSAARRTVETWELASAVLGGPEGETRIDLYDAPADDLWDAAHGCEAEVVAVVAHNPGAGELARRLSGSDAGFPGALAVFAWSEAAGAPRLVLRRDPEVAGGVSRVYKILGAAEWDAALSRGAFEGSPVDLADGYIHLSTAEQVVETARRHFAGRGGLVLLELEATTLGAGLRWEPSRGGSLFPHYYGVLPTAAVLEAHAFPLADDGVPAAREPLRA